MSDYKVMVGDCIESMRTLPDQSVNCCVTSPPYFGLRAVHSGRLPCRRHSA
jgi:DNA modification methylase